MKNRKQAATEKRTPQGKRSAGRLRKILVRTLLVLSAGVLLLILASFVLLQFTTVQKKIKDLAVQTVAQKLGAQLKVGKISGDGWHRLAVEGIGLSTPEGPVLSLDRISVSYALPLLLKRVIFIRDVRIEGLSLNLVEDPGGTWNITKLIPPASQETSDRPPAFNFVLNRLSIANSDVSLVQQRDQGEERRRIQDIQLDVRLKLGPPVTATIGEMRFALDRPRLDLASLTGKVTYVPETKQLQLTMVRIKTPESDLGLNGDLRLQDQEPDVDVNLDITALSLQEVGRLLELEALQPGVVAGILNLQGTPRRLQHQIDLELGRLAFMSRGWLDLTGAAGLSLDVNATLRHMNPAALPYAGLPALAGDLNADLAIKGEGLTQAQRGGHVKLVLGPSHVAGYDLQAGEINLTLAQDDLILAPSRLAAPLGTVQFSGHLKGIADPQAPKKAEFATSVRDFDLAALPGNQGLQGRINLDLTAAAAWPPSADPVQSTASADLRLSASEVNHIAIERGRLKAQWNGEQLELSILDIASNMGRLVSKGSAAPYRGGYNLQTEADLPDLAKLMTLLRPLAPERLQRFTIGGQLQLTAEMQGQLDRPKTAPSKKDAGQVADSLGAGPWKIDPAKMSGRLNTRLQGVSLNGAKIDRGGLQGQWTGKELRIKALEIASDMGQLSLNGAAGLRSRAGRFQLQMDLPDLAKLMAFLRPLVPQLPEDLDVTGNLQLAAEMQGRLEAPEIAAKIESAGITYNEIAADSLALDADWQGVREKFKSAATLNVTALKIKDNRFPRVALTTRLSPAAAMMDLNLKHQAGEDVDLTGRVDDWLKTDKLITIEKLNITNVRAPFNKIVTRVNNREPIRIAFRPEKVDIRSLSLLLDRALLSLSGQWTPAGSQNLTLALANLDVQRISSLWKDEEPLGGTASANIKVTGTAQSPQIEAQIAVKDASGFEVRPCDLDVWLRYADSEATVRSSLYQQKKRLLELNGKNGVVLKLMPVVFQPQPESLELTLVSRDLKIGDLPIPFPKGVDMDGGLDIDLRASGDMTHPKVSGQLGLKDGKLSLATPRVSYETVEAAIRLTPEKIWIDRLRLQGDKEGTLSIAGDVTHSGLAPSALNLRLTGEEVAIPYRKAIQALIQTDLTLDGSLAAPRLTGEVAILKSRIYLDRLGEQGPAEIRVIREKTGAKTKVYLPEEESGGPSFMKPLAADVMVDVPKNSWLKGHGISTEIAGQINLKKDPQKPFVLVGDMRTVRGTFDFRGKIFKITNGNVAFMGLEEPNPNLDLQAETRIQNVTINVNITGTAKEMKLSLDSDPQMEEADIVSYLVFGKPVSALNTQEATSAEQAALNMTGQMAAGELKKILGDAAFLDTLSFDTSGEDVSQGSVSMGKYITPDVFVTYKRGFRSENSGEAEITYEINRNFSVSTQVGEEGNTGVDFFWQYDF
ncbi:MAG: translocation/assembly module TamB domain-containing protein [Desulfobacterales bacterium]|nr:MAG: translocation/assembly module TamB domain-containing protein [Desulfobacterales bacterium]